MLTPETLERLILTEKHNCENWLWDQMSPGSELMAPLKELCRKKIKHHKNFWHTNFILLIGKSLTDHVSMGFLHFASLCELVSLARSIKHEALHGLLDEKKVLQEEDKLNPLIRLSPSALHLMSDTLQSYVLEQLAGFNFPRINEHFCKAQRIFLEAEMLSHPTEHLSGHTSHNKAQAYKAILFQKKPPLIQYSAEGAARICGTNLSQVKELGNYAGQLSMGLSLLREVTRFCPVDEATFEFLEGLGSRSPHAFQAPFGYVELLSQLQKEATQDESKGKILKTAKITSEPGNESKLTPAQIESIKQILKESLTHMEEAFAILVSLSLKNQTPLMAMVEVSMSLVRHMERRLQTLGSKN